MSLIYFITIINTLFFSSVTFYFTTISIRLAHYAFGFRTVYTDSLKEYNGFEARKFQLYQVRLM